MSIIDKKKAKIITLCEQHNVESLYVFGSVLTNKFNQESDVDFIVNFKAMDIYDYADNYFNLKNSLEIAVEHKVDLLEDEAISNPYLRTNIDSTKQLIYG
jgi:predicted nucleotidyltransferase